MKFKYCFLILIMLIVSSGNLVGAADVKVSALPATTTLTDDDLFLTSTYLTGVYTSKKITVTSLKTIFQPSLSLLKGTLTNGYICTYTAAGTLLDCNTNPATFQTADGELTALAGLTSAANAIPYFTGSGTAGVISSSADMVSLLESADYATALTALGGQAVNDDLTTLSSGGTANCLWGEKSDSSGIECKTSINIQMDDSAAQFKSATASKGTLKFDQTGISDTKLVTVKYTATDSYAYTPTLVGNVSHLLGTTWTNGKWCSYSTSTGLTCNEDAPAGTGDMTTDAIWDAKGDLAVGTGANAAAKLAVGTAYQVLHVATDTPGWTSTLGATDTRLTKIWATDLEVTNAPTVNGAALTTILQPLNDDLTTLSAGGTANCVWGEKSDSSGIECKTTLNLQLDDSAAQFKDATDATKTMQLELGSITTGTKRTLTVPDADDTLVGKATTDTLTNKTLDVDGTGNVVKSWGYIVLTHPHLCSAGAPMQTTSTANTYGQCKFGNATDKDTNYAEYYLVVPADIDTSVDLVGTFKFKLGGADTADHEYEISFDSVADSAAYASSLEDAVSLAYTADAAGADGDVETATGTLTGWKAAMTAGQLFVIRVARDGDHATDASTVDSYSGPLVIKYKITQ